MTNLELVITRLTRKTFIPRELFLLSASGKSAMYDALNTAVKKGLIREKRFVKKSAVRKQKTTIAYSLTEKGYDPLSEICPREPKSNPSPRPF